jgi:FecR protein
MKLVRTVHYWSILLHSTLTISLFSLTAPAVLAQGGFVHAYVGSIKGKVQLTNKTRPGPFTLKRKDQLEPGTTIETGPDSSIVILLSDRSQITVLPNSRVELKEYPAAGSAHELLDIQVGRVLVKIHHIGGKPNPYRLNSPAASIAVRGTEFIVDVLQDGETLVVVQEGQVEVWPHNNPGNKRLITPGGRVIVRPGGDISSAFPGPGGELNGRTRVNRDLGGAFQRSVDILVQNSIDIPPSSFTAFPDQHLDSLENPAYAAEFKDAEGRLSMLPSISKPYFTDDDDHRFDYSISPHLTFFTPIPGSRFTVGGSVSALRTRLRNLRDDELPEYGYSHYDNNDLRFNASNFSFIAAYGLGVGGRTSVGIGIDNLSGDGSFLSEYRINSSGYSSENIGNADVRFARTRLTLGLFHKFSDSKRIGVYYRHGINSSNLRSRILSKSEISDYPDATYNSSLFNETDISTLSSEVGIRYRAQMTRRLFYGIEGSYLYELIKSRYRDQGQPQTGERDLARRARLAVGTGFAINSRTVLSLDITGGLYNTNKPSFGGLGFFSFYRYSGAFADPLAHGRGALLSGHAMIQTNPWRNLFLSASSLSTVGWNRITSKDLYGVYNSSVRDSNYLTNIGIGWRFKPNLITEYLFSIDHTNRRPSHSLMLRYTFNLSIRGEK